MRTTPLPLVPMGLGSLTGPIPARPIEMGQTTKPLCLCNLQREKDRERAEKKRR